MSALTESGAAGVALAALLSFARVSTVNFATFSEIGFGYQLSPGVIVSALIFARCARHGSTS